MRRIALLTLSLAFAGCSEPSFQTPHQALRTFLDRAIEGDVVGARACLLPDEQPQQHLTIEIDSTSKGYIFGDTVLEGGRAVIPVQFPDETEEMNFVCVEEETGWHVSLSFTIARGVTANVRNAMQSLGEGASPDEIAETMRQAMQNAAPSGR